MTNSAQSRGSGGEAGDLRSRWGFLIAEAILIVVSILFAFAIDAWWDGLQEDSQRDQLLEALRADFAATSEALVRAIAEGEEHVQRTGGYLEVVSEGKDASYDSILVLFSGVTEAAFFQPTVASYRTAVSTGSLELVRNPTLIAALTDFDQQLGLYDLHLRIAGDLFYLHATQDFRLQIGSTNGPSAPVGSPLRSLVPADFDPRGRLAVATAQPTYYAQVNILRNLRAMDEAAQRIVAEIQRMLD